MLDYAAEVETEAEAEAARVHALHTHLGEHIAFYLSSEAAEREKMSALMKAVEIHGWYGFAEVGFRLM